MFAAAAADAAAAPGCWSNPGGGACSSPGWRWAGKGPVPVEVEYGSLPPGLWCAGGGGALHGENGPNVVVGVGSMAGAANGKNLGLPPLPCPKSLQKRGAS